MAPSASAFCFSSTPSPRLMARHIFFSWKIGSCSGLTEIVEAFLGGIVGSQGFVECRVSSWALAGNESQYQLFISFPRNISLFTVFPPHKRPTRAHHRGRYSDERSVVGWYLHLQADVLLPKLFLVGTRVALGFSLPRVYHRC